MEDASRTVARCVQIALRMKFCLQEDEWPFVLPSVDNFPVS
jgi:hypothetical protein